jgi:hypothetical protein
MADAVQQFVISFTDPPCFAVANHRTRRVRMMRTRRAGLAPPREGLGEMILQDVGDQDQQPGPSQRSRNPVPAT